MTNRLVELFYAFPAILIALTLHEFSHGATAHLLGDPTPKQHGRLTLNPLPHLDLFGTILIVVSNFGWAKPVPINPFYFRGNRETGLILVSLAGPAANLLVALLGAILYNLVDPYTYLWMFARILILINVYLAVFNLVPIPPLDGSKILASLLPIRLRNEYYRLEPYGTVVLLLLIAFDIVGPILIPIAQVVINTFVRLGGMFAGGL